MNDGQAYRMSMVEVIFKDLKASMQPYTNDMGHPFIGGRAQPDTAKWSINGRGGNIVLYYLSDFTHVFNVLY